MIDAVARAARNVAATQEFSYLRTGEGLWVTVRVLQARRAYGRSDVLVTPWCGAGSAWVSAARLTAALPELCERCGAVLPEGDPRRCVSADCLSAIADAEG